MQLLGPISPHPYPGFYSLRSSRLLCYMGKVPPQLFFTVWGFVNFGAGCCRSRRYLADDLQMPSLRRPKWVLLLQSRPKWVLIVFQTTCRGPADAKPEVDPSGSCSSRVDPSGSCSSRRRPTGDLQTPSLRRPKWVLLIQSRPKWVLLVLQTPSLSCPKWVLLVLRRPKGVLIVQSRPQWVLVAQSSTPAVPGPSRRRCFDSPQRSSDHSSRQGSHTSPPQEA